MNTAIEFTQKGKDLRGQAAKLQAQLRQRETDHAQSILDGAEDSKAAADVAKMRVQLDALTGAVKLADQKAAELAAVEHQALISAALAELAGLDNQAMTDAIKAYKSILATMKAIENINQKYRQAETLALQFGLTVPGKLDKFARFLHEPYGALRGVVVDIDRPIVVSNDQDFIKLKAEVYRNIDAE